jgi:predicted type IV restriction endonuclease/predicted transport protein
MTKNLGKIIEELQVQHKKHRRSGLRELPTRLIFIDPVLSALGWDVRDPAEVEVEFETIDGKSMDYALKINKKPVILLEAKTLDDPLNDVKGIAQVVSYAAVGGIEWCVLTNGIRYRVYSSSEKATAPNKLLFEVSIDPENQSGHTLEQMVVYLERLSRDSMARGVLDEIGEEIFTTAKVRKALDRLFAEQDDSFLSIVRKAMNDTTISKAQIRAALARIWRGETPASASIIDSKAQQVKPRGAGTASREKPDYGEERHTEGRPAEVVELYRALDRFCNDLAPGKVTRRYRVQHIGWSVGKSTFCSVHLLQSGLKGWLRISPRDIPSTATYIRDVSKVGHWGVGNVEMAIDSMELLHDAEPLIRASFELVAKNEP